MQWFRFYSEVLDDPKVQRLPGDLFKAWVNLLCLANLQDERGTLPELADVAFRLRLSDDDLGVVLAKLVDRGLLDDDGSTLRVHGWESRQYRSDADPTAAERKRRQRDRERDKNNVTRDISVTAENVTRTESESDTEADQKQSQIQKQREKAPRVTRAPRSTIDSYEPSPDFLDAMHEERPDLHLPIVIDNWRDYHREHGKVPKDFDASLRRWIRNEKQGKHARATPVILDNGREVDPSTARKLQLVAGLNLGGRHAQ